MMSKASQRRRRHCCTTNRPAGYAPCVSTPAIFAATKCCARKKDLCPLTSTAVISVTTPCAESRRRLRCPAPCPRQRLFSCKERAFPLGSFPTANASLVCAGGLTPFGSLRSSLMGAPFI